MSANARSALTLTALLLVIVAAAVWGWQALTKPIPTRTSVGVCEDTTFAAGELLTPDLVAVRVLNASDHVGLASRTMESLTGRGFVSAGTGNLSGADITGVQIWSDEPDNPAVQLLKSQFRKATVVPGEPVSEPGLVLVLGNRPSKLAKNAPTEVTTTAEATLCSPPLDE